MKFVFALSTFVIFLTLECQGVKIPKEFPKGTNGEPMLPVPPPMPGDIPQQVEIMKHGKYGGYGGYGGYRPYRPGPKPEPRPRKCRDKKDASFCQQALLSQKCYERRYQKKCAKTCGICSDELDCVDSGARCKVAIYQPRFYCALPWFAAGCRKTCNKCPTTTTTTEVPTTTRKTTAIITRGPEEYECVDILQNCHYATSFRCALFWFRSGCERTCGVCEPATQSVTMLVELTTSVEATTTEEATTTTTTEEATTSSEVCQDKRDDCNTFLDWYCDIPIIADECQKFCGKCPENTTVLPVTTQSTEAESTTFPQTEVATKSETTVTTGAVNTTESTTEETTQPEMTPAPEGSGEEQLCIDSDEKNCATWESLGLCYNPEFMDEMARLCRLSCQMCQ